MGLIASVKARFLKILGGMLSYLSFLNNEFISSLNYAKKERERKSNALSLKLGLPMYESKRTVFCK